MIQFLAHRLLIVTTCYFDDYVVFSKESLSKNTELTFATLLDILGWKFDKSGDKAGTMSTAISPLGVEFCLGEAKAGIISVQNTAKRKKELASQISEALAAGKLSASAAASLKGRLGFAEGQLFGRSTRKLVNELGRHSLAPPGMEFWLTLLPLHWGSCKRRLRSLDPASWMSTLVRWSMFLPMQLLKVKLWLVALGPSSCLRLAKLSAGQGRTWIHPS